MIIRRWSVPFLALALSLGCSGDIGPVGPTGPAGPQGQPGVSADVQSQMVRITSDGTAVVGFAGLQVEDAVVNCWMSDSTAGPWLAIATDLFTGLSCGAGNSGPDLRVGLVGGIAGWWFLVTVVAV